MFIQNNSSDSKTVQRQLNDFNKFTALGDFN